MTRVDSHVQTLLVSNLSSNKEISQVAYQGSIQTQRPIETLTPDGVRTDVSKPRNQPSLPSTMNMLCTFAETMGNALDLNEVLQAALKVEYLVVLGPYVGGELFRQLFGDRDGPYGLAELLLEPARKQYVGHLSVP